jgi:preprotein translocase subunit SecG
MRRDGAAALGALVQLRRLPAMRRLAGAQAHLRSFAFGNSHKKGSRKAGFCQKTTAFASIMLMLLIMILIFWKDQEQDQDQEQEFLD